MSFTTDINFITDKQTLEDLNLLGKYKPNSFFSFFNQVRTAGGERLLEQMFRHPLTNATEINNRSSIFNYFQEQNLSFPFDPGQFSVLENYLSDYSGRDIFSTGLQVVKKQLSHLLIKDEQYQDLLFGVKATADMLRTAVEFIAGLAEAGQPDIYKEKLHRVRTILSNPRFSGLMAADKPLSLLQVIRYDHLFRSILKADMECLLQFIQELDVCICVTHIATEKALFYATALPKEANVFKAAALRHPGIDKAVANPVSFDQNKNVIFLTGANMAGKSTFMKTVGVSLYLAHMGFPVGAESLTFSIMDGIYSSINVPDNLSLGYSHFYAEVLRVKTVAEEVSAGKNLLVIFDELFKGTNVKDAYDATYAVTSSFSEYRNCLFIISTHIIEVGEELQKEHRHFRFLYLPTVMEGNVPRYTFRLKEGITTDRQGMIIIENEGVLDLIQKVDL